jgi:polyhydroxyalkanoate synthesis regulator phasin
MKKALMIAGIATLVAILGVAAVGAVAFAQDATDSSGTPFDFGTKFREALAGILGISVDDYNAAVDKAETQVVDEAVADGWLTKDQAEMLQWRLDQQPEGGLGRGLGMGGRGMGHMGMMGSGGNTMSVVSDKVGMTLTELMTAFQDGKSVADLAKDKGVDLQTIVDALVAQVKESLDKAVADGNITQKQADYQLEQYTTQVTEQLNGTWESGGRFGGGRHGKMMDFPGMGGF